MKKLAVLNWAGHGNLGDELFNDAYTQLFPNWDIYFFTNSPNAGLPLIDFDFINNECDLFALGGGELINSSQLFLPSYWTHKIKSEIPKIILGCGVNIDRASQLNLNVIQELHNFSYIGLRDLASIRLLHEEALIRDKIGLFYDLAFSLDFSSIKPQEQKDRTTVIIPTNRFTNKYDRGIRQYNILKHSLKWLKNRASIFDKVMFLAFGKEDNDDYKSCLELSKLLPNSSEIIPDCATNKQAALQAISDSYYVLTYRLHGLVLAKMFNKPCGYYPYHWKLDRVYDTLLGCDPKVIAVWQRECLSNVLENFGLCG